MSVDKTIPSSSHGDPEPLAGPSSGREPISNPSTDYRHRHVQLSPVLPSRETPVRYGEEAEGHRDPRQRMERAPSHISMDYFDPRGVRKISRTLSSAGEPLRLGVQTTEEPLRDSEDTATPGERFDFEKTVRTWLEKFVPSI